MRRFGGRTIVLYSITHSMITKCEPDPSFLVISGHLLIKLRDGDIHLDPGEFVIIPHGVEHLPVAEQEVQVLLLEPKTTVNTGTVTNERTVANPERL